MTTYIATQASAMTRVYRNMALSVFNSMVVAYIVSQSPPLTEFFLTGAMKWVVLVFPLALIFAVYTILQNNESPIVAHGLLHIFATIMGISLSAVFIHYSVSLITSALMSATVLFTTMAIYGMTTKRDLTSLGGFLIVGLIALIVVSVINLFIGNSGLDLVLSGIGVIIFLGFTAYNAQNIQEIVRYGSNTNLEVMGALSLYLDFVNLFLDLLRIFGALSDD